MDLTKTVPEEKVELQIAPLIDVVFLLLIYFMVTTALIKKEADISFMLPASVDQVEPIDLPIEVTIEIDPAGDVMIEGVLFPSSDRELLTLATRLTEFRQSAESAGSELIVNILPNDSVPHRRIVDVMNACAIANVKNTSFTMEM
ncbi:MAG: biopolymer transporter ExbD [Kiritimatiellales bacterium]|nr:biopolymer transporter ExbD [Kiritimatiellales bacterium]